MSNDQSQVDRTKHRDEGGDPESAGTVRPGRTIQSVDRALSVLEEVAQTPNGISLSALARLTGLNISTCHHLVSTLAARGYLEPLGRAKGYAIGPRLRELNEMAEAERDPAVVLRGDLEQLGARLGHGVQLAMLSETSLLTKLSFQQPGDGIEEHDEIEKMRALHATATGKAILAWIPDTELARIVSVNGMTRYTPRTLTTLSSLVDELRLVRRRKYAIDDEEFREGIVCIGAAVRDKGGAVVAAISTTLPADLATPEYRKELTREVVAASNQYSQTLRNQTR